MLYSLFIPLVTQPHSDSQTDLSVRLSVQLKHSIKLEEPQRMYVLLLLQKFPKIHLTRVQSSFFSNQSIVVASQR